MKTTGIAVALAGLLMAVFAAVAGPLFTASPNGPGVPSGAERTAADLTVPVVFGVVAMLVGGMMVVLGGRSYVASQNPAVRN